MSITARIRLFALGLAVLACTRQGFAAGTLAGTAITNTAQVTYTLGTVSGAATSNTTTTTVLQVLNVVATAQTPTVSVIPGDTRKALTFRITNTGNGPDTYTLTPLSTLPGDNFDPVLSRPASVYFDTDGNGFLSAGDTAYVPGADVPLAADAGVTVFVLNNIPPALNNGDTGLSQITAARKGGPGKPGQSLGGGGVGGIDAVFGTSGDQAVQSGKYLVGNNVTLNAVKTQAVADLQGGARPLQGATITYTIVITPTGSGTATAASFSDPIPANTTFRAGSLRLNAIALTDAAGDDAGEYDATPTPMVKVALGDLTAASGAQTVQFAVTIN